MGISWESEKKGVWNYTSNGQDRTEWRIFLGRVIWQYRSCKGGQSISQMVTSTRFGPKIPFCRKSVSAAPIVMLICRLLPCIHKSPIGPRKTEVRERQIHHTQSTFIYTASCPDQSNKQFHNKIKSTTAVNKQNIKSVVLKKTALLGSFFIFLPAKEYMFNPSSGRIDMINKNVDPLTLLKLHPAVVMLICLYKSLSSYHGL